MGILSLEQVPIIVGNGGFSLRSKKLLEEVSNLEYTDLSLPEDVFICTKNRKTLLDRGIRYAPLTIAKRFSFECPLDLNEKNITLDAHFGFHGTHHYKQELVDLLDNYDEDVQCVKLIKKYYEKN